MDTKFKFEALKARIVKMKEVLPVQLAAQAQSYFVGSWAAQGWDGAAWKTPLRREGPGTSEGGAKGTPEWRYPKIKDLGRRTRATLVGSRANKNKSGQSLRAAVNNSIRSQVFGQNGIRLLVDVVYADAHNSGLGKMPQRKFMGDSPILRVKQIKKIKQFTDNVWQA